ncbi:MAG: type IV secretion protein DotH [Alphaproteobacteria bacterium]|nr:type IV secretion protein DotH [Alphaproteobacteria bacterium]
MSNSKAMTLVLDKIMKNQRLVAAVFILGLSFTAQAQAQMPQLPGEQARPADLIPSLPGDDLMAGSQSGPQENAPPPLPSSSALPAGSNNSAFSFDDDSFSFDKSPDQVKEKTRNEAFDAALQGLLPLRPEEIRTLLERFDRTQESVEVPIYPAPTAEVAVQNISLDPGAKPAVVKLAYGHVSTVSFLDVTGAPWPVQDISWAGNFQVMEAVKATDGFTHMFRISPQSEFAYGNMSISLVGLKTPVIITLETGRDKVHYRFDAIISDYGPLAEAPLIAAGITTTAGSTDMASVLEGAVPSSAVRLGVDGVDGRTSAYRLNQRVYVRTPLTLLSPGWSSSVASADGTHVYEIDDAPVLLLSDRGRMVRARLSDREGLKIDE